MYEQTVRVGWAQVDMNGHMRNSAYLDVAVDVRMFYFAASGFPAEEFARQSVGPTVRTDEIEFFREVHLADTLRITLELAGLAEDGSRWKLRQEIYRSDGQLAARVNSMGGFIDLQRRVLREPPLPLRDALHALPHTSDFTTLRSSVKRDATSASPGA